MKLTSSRAVLAFASVALLVGAAACGDDDDNSSSATTAAAATATTAAAATTAAPTTAEATTTTAAATTTTAATTTAAAAGGATATTAAGGTAAAGGAVALADTSLGKVLVDSKGMTLYIFTPDQGKPTSVCLDKCLAAWPALIGPATAGAGLDASKFGTVTRSDNGQAQVTYGGWPLYTFVQDTKPGDVVGQDFQEKWYVIGADGQPIGMS